MAKKCLYCGQLLAKEDARFCNECGRVQDSLSPAGATAATAGPGLIKVKLPPKELSPIGNSFGQQERSRPNQAPPGTARTPQREQSVPPSARLPKRPVRLTAQELTGAQELSGKSGESAGPTKISGKVGDAPSIPVHPANSARTGASSLPTPSAAEAESTMVLSGWREELERVRKEQATTSSPAKTATPSATTSEAAPIKPSAANAPVKSARTSFASEDEPAWFQPSPSARFESGEKPAPPKAPQRDAFSEPMQSNQATKERTPLTEQPRRELHVKVWEQEPTLHFPNISAEKGQPGPVPAIEHTPFAEITFDPEEQAKQIAQVETIHWEAFSSGSAPTQKNPEPAPFKENKPALERQKAEAQRESRPSLDLQKSEEKRENKPTLAEEKRTPGRDNQSTREKIEDQPTAHLAVPEVAQHQPGIVIERTSTPAPTAWTPSSSEEVENQPTRPMQISLAAPSSPLPPTAPQISQVREQQARPASANPTSLSGTAGQTLNAAQTSDAFGMLGSRGQAASSHASSGQTFDPASLPPLPLNPASNPGIALSGAGMQNTQSRPSDAFDQRPASFAPPSSSWPGTPSATGSEESKPREKKRASGKRVLLTLVVLIILGGIGALVYYQYSSGGAQPYQSFQNSTLGVAFNYPQSWVATVNQAQNSAHFADSSQTGQITLSTAAANGQQLNQYISQESTQLGLNGAQTKPALTFAGTSWQEIQGSVTQKGVTDTLALYVTTHNGRFYSLVLQAPATAYAQMEQTDFKQLRSSFSFL